jgi:hypothetical protein
MPDLTNLEKARCYLKAIEDGDASLICPQDSAAQRRKNPTAQAVGRGED